MTIKERLQEDWKQALKSKDKPRAEVLTMAKAAILQVEKTDNVKVEDPQAIEILAKEVKMRRDASVEFARGNRQDLVDKSNFEIETLLSYLPKQLEEKEIEQLVEDIANRIGANNIKDMGKLMAALKPEISGKADGKLVSNIVKNYLNK